MCSFHCSFVTWVVLFLIYRVSGLSCPEAGGCKSAILRGFPDVFSLFGPLKVGEFSFWYSWTTGMKKSWEISSSKKRQISGLAQIKYFLLNESLGLSPLSQKFLCSSCWNFLNFPNKWPLSDLPYHIPSLSHSLSFTLLDSAASTLWTSSLVSTSILADRGPQ